MVICPENALPAPERKSAAGFGIMRSMKMLFLNLAYLFVVASIPTSAIANDDRTEAVLASDVLLLAEEIGQWLADQRVPTSAGVAWPDDALNPDNTGYDLASGVAGKVLYFVALYRATANDEYLDLALGGADYLAALLHDSNAFNSNARKASLYSGIGGIGVALVHAQAHAHHAKYADALDRVISLLDEWRVDDSQGTYWSDEYNDLIFGDAGTILFLSWYAEQTGDERALDMAVSGAHFILGQGNDMANGKSWYFRRSKLFNLPNFSHGTAGVAYVLATVGAQTNDEALQRGAQAGFNYLKSIAEAENGLLRIPYGWGSDSWDGLYEFGWAHGLAGTISLFIRLQETGIDEVAASEYESLARHTLESIGLTGRLESPFAEPSTPFDLRFGRAGVLARLDDGQAGLRNDIWAQIEQAAIRDAGTAYWEVNAPEFMGGGRAAYTGLFHGAAGIGLAMLRMHAQMTGRQHYVDLPDYPAK